MILGDFKFISHAMDIDNVYGIIVFKLFPDFRNEGVQAPANKNSIIFPNRFNEEVASNNLIWFFSKY